MQPRARGPGATSFGASLAILVKGTVVGQALTLAAAPILTRLYTPAELGVLAMFTSIVAILSVAVCLRYEVAIPLAPDDATARRLTWLSLAIVGAVSAAAGIVASVIAIPLRDVGAMAELSQHLVLLVPSLVGVGIVQTLTYLALRRRRFSAVSTTSATQAATQAGAQVAMGVAHLGAFGLLLGHAAGRLVGAAVLINRLERDPALRSAPSWRDLAEVAHSFRRFPKLSLSSSVINSVSAHLPVLLVALFFGATVVGFYGYTVRVLQTPMGLVGQSAGQVFYAEAAGAQRAALRDITLGVFRRLVAIAAGPLLLVVIAGPTLFSIVFGPSWEQAGAYARWLAPWLFLVFVAAPISPLVFVLERQRQELVFQSTLLVGRAGAVVAGATLGGADLAIGLLGSVSACMWAAYTAWLLRLVEADLRGPAIEIVLRLARATAISLPVIAALVAGVEGPAVLVILIATAIALPVDAWTAVRGARGRGRN